MKKLIQYMMLALAILGAVVFGRPNDALLKNATVRIIRMDDLEAAIKDNRLPRSFTGAVMTEDGFIYTSLNAARDADGTLDPRIERNSYLVLFPRYDAKDGRVTAVYAHLGYSRFRSEENHLLAIKVPPTSLPPTLIVDRDILQNNDSNTQLIEIGYPTSQYKGLEKDNEATKSVLADLYAFAKNVREDDRAKAYDETSQAGHAALMSYMSSCIAKSNVSRVSNQIGGGTSVFHNAELSEGCEGAPLFDENSGYIKAMVVDIRHDDNALVSISVRNDTLLAFAASNRLDLPTGLPWLWIAIGGGAIVLLAIIVFLVSRLSNRSAGSSARRNIVLRLRGEDGTQHALSTRDLQHGVILGRSSSAHKRFTKQTISGKHAVLGSMGGKAVITDHNSKGGTFVNGKKLTPGIPEKLHDGDVLTLADYKIFVSGVSE